MKVIISLSAKQTPAAFLKSLPEVCRDRSKTREGLQHVYA